MLKIGQFSKLARVTVKTLRYYDKIGLLRPALTDPATAYRYYTEDQLQTVRLIFTYKEAQLPNDVIMKLIGNKEDGRALLEAQKQILDQREKEIQSARCAVERLLGETEKQTYAAAVKNVEKRVVYYCRGYVANAGSIYDFMKACAAELVRTNPDVHLSQPDYCCVIYPDDGYRESNIFIEYVQSVDRFGTDTGTLKFKELEPVTVISVLHRGNYDTLPDAYLFAVNWARENGYTLRGEPRERYINGQWNRADVSEWLTEVQLPVWEEETP